MSEAESEKRTKFRRSLVTRSALPRGHVITEADLDAKRPGTGIAPDECAMYSDGDLPMISRRTR